MNDTVIIDAEIKKNDIRPLCSAELRHFFGSPSLIIVGSFLTAFVLYSTGFRLTMETLHVLPLPLIVLFCILLLFFTAIWRGSAQSYRRNKMYLTPTHFEFSDENIQVTSKYGFCTLMWKDINRVKEGKPAFILSYAGTDEYVINRHSFQSQTQLDCFFSFLESHIDANKLSLKHYSLGQGIQNSMIHPAAAVDTKTVTPSISIEKQAEPASAADVTEIRVSLSLRETISYELGRYYRRGFGLIVSLLGLLLLAFFVYNRIRNLSSLITDIIILVTGCFLLFGIPFSIWLLVRQNFKLNAGRSQEQVFRYDGNYLSAGCDNDMTKYRWNELVSSTRQKNGFVFTARSQEDYRRRTRIISKKSGKEYYIPRRSFQSAKDCALFESLLTKTQ